MPYMFLTLEVSKLSGWLKAFAFCRESKGGACDAGRGADREAGGREARWRKRRARGRPDSRLGDQGTRGAHCEHVAHGRDIGGVEAQRLVERRCALPS